MHVLNAFISCLVAVLFYPCEKRGAASPEMSHAQSLATLVRRAAKQVTRWVRGGPCSGRAHVRAVRSPGAASWAAKGLNPVQQHSSRSWHRQSRELPSAQVWAIIRFLLDEFEPWLKWLVFDAVLRLVVAWLISKSERLRSFFGMLGFSDL